MGELTFERVQQLHKDLRILPGFTASPANMERLIESWLEQNSGIAALRAERDAAVAERDAAEWAYRQLETSAQHAGCSVTLHDGGMHESGRRNPAVWNNRASALDSQLSAAQSALAAMTGERDEARARAIKECAKHVELLCVGTIPSGKIQAIADSIRSLSPARRDEAGT